MASTKLIDVDRDLLRSSAEAALHAARQSWAHLRSELDFEQVGDVESIMATLVPNEPYSFVSSGGDEADRIDTTQTVDYSPSVAITREAVFKHYTRVHSNFVIERFDPLLELRGPWYTFFESLTTLGIKGTDQNVKMVNLVLLASGAGPGITGEISAVVDPAAGRDAAAAAGRSPEAHRHHRVEMHDAYLQALLDGNTSAIVDLLGDKPQSLVRDYVEGTGALVNLKGVAAHREHYGALFDLYGFERADVLQRVAQDAYLFSEVRLVGSRRGGSDGGAVDFRLAEWFADRPGGGVLRMGHGSDLG